MSKMNISRYGSPYSIAALVVVLFAIARPISAVERTEPSINFTRGDGELAIKIGNKVVATYCWKDSKITRPYFANVQAPGGVRATRQHPPVAGQDAMDHDKLHPGIWLSFGDISGSDYWRLKARTEHVDFADLPHAKPGSGSFAVHNRYLSQKDPDQVVCNEEARYTILTRPEGYLLIWDSTFNSDHEFTFGDQEEMGLGLRVATPLRASAKPEGKVPPGNGTILDSKGRRNEKEVWGNTADWCDYSGTIDGQHVGLTIMCHPDNFRPSWFHARDRGLLEANPFGRNAFRKGEKSAVVVKPGEKLRLRYGILIHSGPKDTNIDLPAAYIDYVQQAAK